MKKIIYNRFLFSIAVLFSVLIYFTGCTDKGSPSLYQGIPSGPVGATPSISSINPPDLALAGVTEITITGTNFSSVPSQNLVFFNGIAGSVTASSPTQLTVISPNIFGDTVEVKVAELNSELFSNSIFYKLNQAAEDLYPDSKSTFVLPFSITFDNVGNLYISATTNAVGTGIQKVNPDDLKGMTDYASKGAETFWNSMKFGPGGVLYTARSVRAIFQIPAGGGAPATFIVLKENASITQLDFDANHFLWAGGKADSVYRINVSNKAYKGFATSGNVSALRVFDNYLYVAQRVDSLTTIVRYPIDSNNDLGPAESYFDFSGAYGANYLVNAIDFSADGDMYLGTNLTNPIIIVHADKTSQPLYPSILKSAPAISFAWGNGNYLYYVRAKVTDINSNVLVPQTIVKLDLLKPGAPYYGNN
jgi:hypothetical protein